MTHDTKIYLAIADKKIFISQRKLEIAQRNKNPVRINIHNGKIVKRSGKNKWQVLLLAGVATATSGLNQIGAILSI